MNLLEALRRAKQAITPDKNDSVRRHVLVTIGKVVASDGEVTTTYAIENAETNAAISYDQVAPLLRSAEAITRFEWEKGGSTIGISVINDGGGEAHGLLNVLPVSQFKQHAFNPERDLDYVDADPQIASLADFVGDDPTVPQYAYLHFDPTDACATDQKSAAIVAAKTPWTNWLLPAQLFQHWPKGVEAKLARMQQGALVHLEDELRYAPPISRKGFPDVVGRLLPHQSYDDACIMVEAKAFTSAVKQASGSSKLGIVWLDHGDAKLSIRAETLGEGHAYASALQGCYAIGHSESSSAFDGKRVLRALKACKTPVVLVSQPHAKAPLRIESGPLVTAIWPLDMESSRHGQTDRR